LNLEFQDFQGKVFKMSNKEKVPNKEVNNHFHHKSITGILNLERIKLKRFLDFPLLETKMNIKIVKFHLTEREDQER